MNKIYVDVTNAWSARFLTGIQRVVICCIRALYKLVPDRIELIVWWRDERLFRIVRKEEFCKQERALHECAFTDTLNISDFKPGDVFMDMDAAWHIPYKRSSLLPDLKRQGVYIVLFLQDIIAISDPQFFTEATVLKFINYIGAHLQYDDHIIVTTNFVLSQLRELENKLGVKRISKTTAPLGIDDFSKETNSNIISDEVKKAAVGKYLLVVGTIEPRKNLGIVLDAFEKNLFNEGYTLIIAGKIGWDVDELIKHIYNSRYYGSKLFHFKGLDDNSIKYLYNNAIATVMASHIEGFGMPIVESLAMGTPVLAADIPVFHEVSQGCALFFDQRNVDSFIESVSELRSNKELQNKISRMQFFTWEDTAKKILASINSVVETGKEWSVKKEVRQMYVISARKDAVEQMLPFVENFMPFIEELVIGCPNDMAHDFEIIRTGHIRIRILSDELLLGNMESPVDHGKRNFLLRCLAMRTDVLDEVFIMSDDDYRPLRLIEKSFFIEGNHYNAYYYDDLFSYGATRRLTSYDNYIHRTRDFVQIHHFPSKVYSAHMPQIIDKELYLKMLDEFPGLENEGLDEWSSYFNYAQYHYPTLICSKIYETIGWPAYATGVRHFVKQQKYSFENYYSWLYSEMGIFAGYSEKYHSGIEIENREKEKRYDASLREAINWQHYTDQCLKKKYEKHEEPTFLILKKDESYQVFAPNQIPIVKGACVRLRFSLLGFNMKDSFCFGYSMIDKKNGNLLCMRQEKVVVGNREFVDIPVWRRTDGTEEGNPVILWRIQDWEKRLVSTSFLLPFYKINRGDRIVLYGAGNCGKNFKQQLEETRYCEVVRWVDKNADEKNIAGVRDVKDIFDKKFDAVLIAIATKSVADEISENLIKMGIQKEKILWANPNPF